MNDTRRGARSRRVICILGAPRTGTHLVNSVLCGSDEVLPMLTESAPVNAIVRAYRSTLSHLERFPGIHFERPEEVRVLFGGVLGEFIDRLCERYDREVCVIRSPMLTRSVDSLRELLAAAGADARFICMVRDPRDVIASMRRWGRERERRGGAPLVDGDNPLGAMLRWVLISYRELMGPEFDRDPGDDVLFVRFEDLVNEPERTASRIGQFTSLVLGDPRSGAGWQSSPVQFTPDDERIGEAVTELFGQPLSPAAAGTWGRELSDAEAARILRTSRAMLARFYPELVVQV